MTKQQIKSLSWGWTCTCTVILQGRHCSWAAHYWKYSWKTLKISVLVTETAVGLRRQHFKANARMTDSFYSHSHYMHNNKSFITIYLLEYTERSTNSSIFFFWRSSKQFFGVYDAHFTKQHLPQTHGIKRNLLIYSLI